MAHSSGGREKSSGGGTQDLRVHGAQGQKKRRNREESRNLSPNISACPVPTPSRTSVQRALLVSSLLPRSPVGRSLETDGLVWICRILSLPARPSVGRKDSGLPNEAWPGPRTGEEWQTYIGPGRPTDMPAEFLSRERFRAQLRNGGRKEGASIFEKVKVRRAKRTTVLERGSPIQGPCWRTMQLCA